MDTATWVMAGLAVVLLGVAYLGGRQVAVAGLERAGNLLWSNLPLLLLSFLVAGLVQALLPQDLVVRWLGREAGWKGVLLGCVAGGLVPGSPYALFPVVGALYKTGASLGAVVGFLTAWALWSVTRLPLEAALVGPRVMVVRLLCTLGFPPLAGLLAHLVAGWTGWAAP